MAGVASFSIVLVLLLLTPGNWSVCLWNEEGGETVPPVLLSKKKNYPQDLARAIFPLYFYVSIYHFYLIVILSSYIITSMV